MSEDSLAGWKKILRQTHISGCGLVSGKYFTIVVQAKWVRLGALLLCNCVINSFARGCCLDTQYQLFAPVRLQTWKNVPADPKKRESTTASAHLVWLDDNVSVISDWQLQWMFLFPVFRVCDVAAGIDFDFETSYNWMWALRIQYKSWFCEQSWSKTHIELWDKGPLRWV
jgi:hypothetical protein